jgi:excisionase family DNA binding protein
MMSAIIEEFEQIARRVFQEEMARMRETEAASEQFVMVREAAAHLHLKPATLRYWVSVKYREIPFHRAGRRVLFKLSELDEWSKEQASVI